MTYLELCTRLMLLLSEALKQQISLQQTLEAVQCHINNKI